MWLGEQITERGIGNGISLIIFAGIVARMPNAIASTFELLRVGQLSIITLLVLTAVMVLVVAVIIFVETGQRRLPVQYANELWEGGFMEAKHPSSIEIEHSRCDSSIFASSILMFPLTVANFVPRPWLETHPWVQSILNSLGPGALLYNLLYVGFIIFFCYFTRR